MSLPKDFDWQFYLNYYQDLKNAGLKIEKDAIFHYINHGQYENRIYKNILPKISLITSMKNSEKYLQQFINNTIEQTIFITNCEWIIIDANDNDADYNILKPFLDKYPNIIYKKIEKDDGIYSCWNKAIEISTGDFITNINCDDRRFPTNLEKMTKLLYENNDVSLVYCDSYITRDPNVTWTNIKENCERYNFSEFENLNLLNENAPHCNPMWRKSLHSKYGFFDEKYKSAGDWDFWLRCWTSGEKFKKHPEILGIYYVNPNGLSTNLNNKINFVDNEEREIFNKFDGLKQVNLDFVIVSHDKINSNHGTGIYLSNLTKFDKNFLTISSTHFDSYFEINSHDNNDIRDIKINYNDFKPIEINLENVNIEKYFDEKVKNINTNKILSVPYSVEDVMNAILLKNKTGAKLVTYIMDDQNIVHNNIPDNLMRELLEKSDLRLCISKDMCREYNKKYSLDFYFLPPLVKNESIKKEYTFTNEEWINAIQKNSGVMVGNIWNAKWLDKLSKLTKNLNIKINWFSPQKINNDKIIELRECGINYLGHRPESELLDILNSSPFGLILTNLNEDDDRKDLTYSLSSKLTYMMSVANLPIISIGDKKTTNSKFVKEMNIGLNSEYTINEIRDCINEIMNFSSQEKFRKNSYYIGNQLNIDYHFQSSINWIWKSCEIRKPINNKYENLGKTLKNSKVIVSSVEINNLHGTGPLIKRVVGCEDNTLVILSKLHYDFKNDFGDVVLHIDSSKIERRSIIDKLGNNEIEQILCVPYFKEDLITSITLHDEFNIPMGCYIMDDQNIVYNNIPDDLMFEFLSKCSVRFVTHPELRNAYENKFKLKFYIIPQIVQDELINKEEYDCEKNSNGAIIGSIWSYNWLKKLCQTLKESNVKVDWYGNNKYYWLNETDEELISYGLNPLGLLSEEGLSKKLKSYPYVIVPYGTLEDDDDAKNLTKLSLPGRIIFASATANIPVIVMGSEQCSAAQFVTKFGIGTVCDYNGNSLIEAINSIKENEKELRKNAFLLANNFSSKGIEEFLWNSISIYKRLFDLRFENVFKQKYEINSYSQHGEDLVIYDYFKGKTGNFLDIGANDGITISNTYKLLKNGWSGTYIEGSPFVFNKLKSNVMDTNTQCLNYFLSDIRKNTTLYQNLKLFDDSIEPNNIDLLSTIDEKSYLRCKEWGSFRQMEIECFTFYDIEKELEQNKYQMISIDIEGLDYEVLSQIDLNKYGTEMVIIEYDNDGLKKKKIIEYCKIFGLNKIIFDNQINMIIKK